MNELARPFITAQDVNPVSMMFDPVISGRCMAIAETLAKGRVSVPDHLRGSVGDCLAIVMQAAAWKLNPFAVAQKTYLIHGRLGYEAQLVNAVVSSLRIIEGRFSYEYIGDWDKLAKPPIIRKSAKGFEIPTPGWKPEDEDGLALIVSAKIRGEPEVKKHKLTLASVWPRNSTLWATNPGQQASYLATKQWVRKYAPDALLGVYTVDELEQEGERIVQGERVDVAQDITNDARALDRPADEESQLDWPQERDGHLVDVRGVIWSPNVHSSAKTCTQEGHWRRRRGITTEQIFQAEKTIEQLRAEEQAAQETTEEEAPEILSEPWFRMKIEAASERQHLEEFLDLLEEADLDKEVLIELSAMIQQHPAFGETAF